MQSPSDPFERFRALYAEAEKADPEGFNAAQLATVGEGHRPSLRVVLLKSFDPRGFVFYTNLKSRKSRELLARPLATLCFFWPKLGQQVRIEGLASQVSDSEADAYFASRPRGSQVGAWASRQSEPLESRALLDRRVLEVERRFEGKEIPRPPFWSGFRLSPDHFEFWANRPDRLHERTSYSQREGGWTSQLLFP